MFQLIQQENVFERIEQKLKEEVTYYAGLPGQCEGEEAMYQVNIPTDLEEQGTDQYDSDDLSYVFIGWAAEGDFVRLQIDLYQKYGEHKELSQYVLEAMHTTFPITSLALFSASYLQEMMEKLLS